jgi:hypothetical protein
VKREEERETDSADQIRYTTELENVTSDGIAPASQAGLI